MEIKKIKERNSLFVKFWSLAAIFHSVTFIWFFDGVSFLESFRILILIFSIIQILYSKHYYFFFSALLLSSSIVVVLPSRVPNHIFFEGIINLTIIGSLGIYGFNFYRGKITLDEIHRKINSYMSPLIVVSLALLYFFVVLHKLNFSFFDPYISCSADFFSKILEDYSLTRIEAIDTFHKTNYITLRNFSIYFAFLSELVIPILLFSKRFRNFGIAYGIFFHAILALYFHIGIYSFSAMMYSYYVFFFDSKSVSHFLVFFNNKKFKIGFVIALVVLFTLYLCLPNIEDSLYLRQRFKLFSVGIFMFLLFAFLVLFQFVKSVGSFKNLFKPSTNTKLNLNFKTSGIVILLLFIFNGMCPYLGLKTEASFSMFSNLRTESDFNNHFFIPSSLRLFAYQDHIITIEDSDIQLLSFYKDNKRHAIIPFELNKIIKSTNNDFYILYNYKGKDMCLERVNGVIQSDFLDVNSNFLLGHLMSFRPVLLDCECQH